MNAPTRSALREHHWPHQTEVRDERGGRSGGRLKLRPQEPEDVTRLRFVQRYRRPAGARLTDGDRSRMIIGRCVPMRRLDSMFHH